MRKDQHHYGCRQTMEYLSDVCPINYVSKMCYCDNHMYTYKL